MLDLSWMAWTEQTQIFFISIAVLLICATIVEINWPTIPKKGILGIVMTRGTRIFLSLLLTAYVFMFWLLVIDYYVLFAFIPAAIITLFIFIFA